MILHAIELTYVGPFRGSVRIGPFARGLNVLAAPNETGKSTSIRATARALFDKHTTKGEELKSLQPVGTDLAPRVVVEFETAKGRYRIEKTFLQSPRSLLKEWQGNTWQPVAEGDLADQWMQDLLHSSVPGRGATKPENWGLLGFLWARQGEPSDWPKLEDEAVGQQIRARLARIELDPVIEKLRGKLMALAESVITSTGQAKTGGPLRQAEDDLAAIEGDLLKLRQTRAELDAKHQQFHQLEGQVAQLEKESASLSASAKILSDQASAAERLRAELETRNVELAGAREKLTTVTDDMGLLAQRQADLVGAKARVTEAELIETRANAALAAVQGELAVQEALRPEKEGKLAALRLAHARVTGLLKLRSLVTEVTALEKQLVKAKKSSALVVALEQKKTQLPTLTVQKLKKLEAAHEHVRDLQAQVQALGLTVELSPENSSRVLVKDAGETRSENLTAKETKILHSPSSLDLQLAGWGRVLVRSGAKEAKALSDELSTAEANLKDALVDAGVASLDAAREAVATRKELDTQLSAAESSLADQLGDFEKLDDLTAAVSAAQRRLDSFTATLQPTKEEAELSDTHLESEDSRQGLAIPAAEKDLKIFNSAVEKLRTAERTATDEIQKATRATGEKRAQLGSLETKIAEMLARYVDGIEAAKTKAQLEFAQAEARVTGVKAQLPTDFEKLPERNRRAASAQQQVANELQARRTERDGAQGSLKSLGGLGLYSQETELEEKKIEAEKRRDAARTKGWGARIAHDLINYRKQVATKAVLAPLEERLSAAFAALTGEVGRHVFLDEQLQVAGVGRTREEAYAFELLSQGAKEQLLLCLRIAVAQELAATEPQVLILDDVLVNTDPVRQERVLDTLGALSATLQVIILTCHAERYRGVGQAVSITSGSAVT